MSDSTTPAAYKFVTMRNDGRWVLDIGRGDRPLRLTAWRADRHGLAVERRSEQHQLRFRLGRLRLTVGHYVWRNMRYASAETGR